MQGFYINQTSQSTINTANTDSDEITNIMNTIYMQTVPVNTNHYIINQLVGDVIRNQGTSIFIYPGDQNYLLLENSLSNIYINMPRSAPQNMQQQFGLSDDIYEVFTIQSYEQFEDYQEETQQQENHVPITINSTKLEDTETACAICLDDNCDYITSCKHSYHVKCLRPWLNNSNICPMCKQSLI